MIGMGFQSAHKRHAELAKRPRCGFSWVNRWVTEAGFFHVCACNLAKDHATKEHRCKCRASRRKR